MDEGINEVGQNIQQSNLSVLIDVMLLRHGDLLTYYGYELFKCSDLMLLWAGLSPPPFGGGGVTNWSYGVYWVGFEILFKFIY